MGMYSEGCHLVLMALTPRKGIGMEVHMLDQFLRVAGGVGEAVLDRVHTKSVQAS